MKGGAVNTNKIGWSGVLVSVQPRIRLTRSFDQRSHSYLGYVLRVDGAIGGEEREFSVAIGEAAHAEHQFRIGDRVGGDGVPVADARTELAELYKVSKLQVHARGAETIAPPQPWHGAPPPLPICRERGHRRLAAKTYKSSCTTCIWGCHNMAVELIVDQWNPSKKRYRDEAFCYGPLSCALYKGRADAQGSGPTRHELARGGLGRRRRDAASRSGARRLTSSRTAEALVRYRANAAPSGSRCWMPVFVRTNRASVRCPATIARSNTLQRADARCSCSTSRSSAR